MILALMMALGVIVAMCAAVKPQSVANNPISQSAFGTSQELTSTQFIELCTTYPIPTVIIGAMAWYVAKTISAAGIIEVAPTRLDMTH